MKAQVNRNTEFIEAKTLVVLLNNARFTIKETIDGRLEINKVSLSEESDTIFITPQSGNEIEIF